MRNVFPVNMAGFLFSCRSADMGNLIKKFGLDWELRVCL